MTETEEEGLKMKNIIGYCDDWNATQGKTIAFKVSTYGPERYRADLVRVICGDDAPEHGIFREEEIDAPFNGEYPGRLQPTDIGSYAVVPETKPINALESFTVQAWVFPTTPIYKGEQGIITYWDDISVAGLALIIDEKGAPALRIGDGDGNAHILSTNTPLAERRWYLISGSYNNSSKTLTVTQTPDNSTLENLMTAAVTDIATGYSSAGSNLMFAAFSTVMSDGRIGSRSHFNGKIDRPRISSCVLSTSEIFKTASQSDPFKHNNSVVAAWDFSIGIGTDYINDVGPNQLHGHTVNLPSRGCKGYNWSGNEQNWQHAPKEYGAIHFHDDDLYDANWETDFEYLIPDNLKSGVYAARLRTGSDESYITFFVRPARGKKISKLAFLASTVTYMAYSNYHWLFHQRFAEVTETLWTTLEKTDVFLQEHNELGLSTYDTHSDSSGVRFASRLRPILNMAPKTPYWSFNADTHILGWLENKEIEYDVITDEDLHNEGFSLLEPYSAVLTGSHPEYYTSPMLEGLRRYIAGKGRLIYMGGNGFIWRCALSNKFPGVLELRRAEDGIRYRDEEPGEYYLEFTGEYGGLWRRLGMPPQAMVGVGTIACGFDFSGHYIRTEESLDPRVSFIFDGIEKNEPIGDYGFLGGGASGVEIDTTNSMMGTPTHALVVARSEGHSENTLICPDEIGFNHATMDGIQSPLVHADMTFFETPGGGCVFSVGSIAWAASLPHNKYDNNVSRLSANVVNRFLEDEPFVIPK